MRLKLFVCPTCGHAELQNASSGWPPNRWPYCEGGPAEVKHMQRMSYVGSVELAVFSTQKEEIPNRE